MIRMLMLLLGLIAGVAPATLAIAATGDKVAISGDNFTVEEKLHQATFTGNVIITQSRIKVTADKVVAFYGEGGATNIKSFEATGHVKIVTKDQRATGDSATFDPKTQMLRLTGNVVVNNAAGQMKGPELLVDLGKNTSVFTGGKSGRVTGVFTSE